MLLNSSHSFAYIGMATRDDVSPLLEDLKVYKDGAAPDDDLTAIVGQWKSTAAAVKSASKPAQEKLAERGIRLLEQLLAVLAQIDQRRAALAV